LVDLGHDVTLYASGDSITQAQLRPLCPRALRLAENTIDANAIHVVLAETVCRDAGEFDFVHNHIDYTAFPQLRRLATPHVTTLHGRQDIPNLQPLYHEFAHEPVISISDHQRRPLPQANWQGTVYHGLPETLYQFQPNAGKYLAFLGRISPEKRVDDAIEVARRAGIPLKIAAKVDQMDRGYYEDVIKPLLHGGVEFVGEISDLEKQEFLGNALGLLFVIDWPEPFGLAMIEALACGTPVIARARGAVPEIIEHATSGFVIETVEEAIEAVAMLPQLDRHRCREIFETRFTAARMAQDYVAVFERLCAHSQPRRSVIKPLRRQVARRGPVPFAGNSKRAKLVLDAPTPPL
jgi:glycosyltransferase involved in cell wall biosynthesis